MYAYLCIYVLDAPLDQQQTLLWHNILKEVMEDVDQLDDTLFVEGEEDEDVTNRNEIPEAVDCYGLPMPISRALRFLFRTERKEAVNTRFFLSTRSVFAFCCLVLVKTQSEYLPLSFAKHQALMISPLVEQPRVPKVLLPIPTA
jgi:hypothetical protein